MAEISKAQQRQKGKASNKTQFAGNFARSIKNKMRRMARTLRMFPDNHELATRLDWWKREGSRTRKGSKA
jgi:hypothetical protein